ncbi:hypothetical protein CALVIDRAFT_543064 [Calocera viscosa TUFC12733]|uniref:Protein kinase domain-containing protein n=1 Tax=Calocera viscosa (strain TUFC12733) TaxID=1330018 RepID=A0A167FZM2_CALVF|nr:hypothetical protein CALVIDRAFT_543064 [Calocera viscosa TUFC12733]
MHGTATVLRRCTVTNGDKCCVKLAVHPVTRTPESDFIQRGWQAGVTQGLPRLLAAGTQKLEHFNRIRSSKGGALEYREIRMTVMEEYTRVPRGLDGDQYKKILLPVFCGHDEMIRSAGVLHRDIKPENIMRREDGTGVLIDYDLASFIRTPDDPHSSPFELTARHRTGTPPFMSIRLLEEELPDGEPFLGNSEADDLDSKFYVLLDFCHQGGIDAALGLVPLMSWPAIAQKKKEFIFNGGRWDEGIRDNCLPLWKEWGHEMALQLAYLARAGDGLIAARSSVISTAKAFKSGTVAHVKRYEDALDEEAVAREKWGKVNEGFCGAFRAIYWPSAEGPIETAFSG